MRKKIMTLMMGMLLLLTACGQTRDNSTSTMLPVAAVQSAAQAIAPTEDKVQEDVDSLLGEENTEEAEPAGGEDTPKLANSAETPSGKMEVTPPPTAPGEPATPASAPEDKPAPAPTPAPTQNPAEKQEEQPAPTSEPAPTPKPAASGNIYSIAEAIQAGNEYARFNCTVHYDAASDEYIVVVLYG